MSSVKTVRNSYRQWQNSRVASVERIAGPGRSPVMSKPAVYKFFARLIKGYTIYGKAQ